MLKRRRVEYRWKIICNAMSAVWPARKTSQANRGQLFKVQRIFQPPSLNGRSATRELADNLYL